MEYPLIDNTYGEEEIESAIDVLRSGRITMGDKVKSFEAKFAAHVGAKYALMVNSGSSANLLAFSAITNFAYDKKIDIGSEVLVPSVCWSTTVSPIIQLGLVPVFVDSDPETLNIDLDDMERKLTERTSAVIVVHVMGNAVNMDRLNDIVSKHSLLLIEDTCEALGSKFRGQHLGTFGEFGTYSFYFSHHITTFEGGMITCNRLDDYNLLTTLRAHGWTRHITNRAEVEAKYPDIDPRFMFINVGYNFRPTDIQGAIGLVQLEKLEEKNNARNFNYALIKRVLCEFDSTNRFDIINPQENCEPAWFSLPIIINDEKISLKKLLTELSSKGIDNRPVITGNVVRQPFIKSLYPELKCEDFPGAETIHQKGFLIGLPCRKLSDESVIKLIKLLLSCC